MANFDEILKQTFTFEGGYDARANDKGNFNSRGELVGTKLGISAPVLEDYLKRPPSVADVKAITPAIATDIYRRKFWLPIKGDKINSQSVAHIIFDAFVNSGGSGLKLSKNATNKVAGKEVVQFNSKAFTDQDVTEINKLNANALFDQIKTDRYEYYRKLVSANPERYSIYAKGWNNRVAAFYFSDPITTAVLAPFQIVSDVVNANTPQKKKKRKIALIVFGSGLAIAGIGYGIHRYRTRY